MATCAACGVELNAGQKFCRQCGTRVADAPSLTSTGNTACLQCRQPLSTAAKFCRYCGAATGVISEPDAAAASPSPLTDPHDAEWPANDAGATAEDRASLIRSRRVPREQRARPWVYMASALAVLFALTGAAYFAWALIFGDPQPDDATIAAALGARLPPFVQLTTASVSTVERIEGTPTPAFDVRFSATGVLGSTVYLRSRFEDGFVFLADAVAAGTPVELAGAATIRRIGETWSSELTLEEHPALAALTPELLTANGNRVIVEGSAEEASYLAELERARDAAQRQAAFEAALAEQLREAENARREAARLAQQAAAIERARIEAERQSQAALTERRRAEAEQQARADALRREQDEANRRQAEAATRAAAITPGRVPRNTETTVQTTTALRSDTARVEDRFETVAAEGMVVDGRVLVPTGSTLRGVVTSVRPATRTNRTARLELSFDQMTIAGRSFPIRARATRVLSGPGLKGDAAKAGIGAGLGALIGGLLGGTQGAVLGGAIGAGGTIAATEGKEIDLPPGTNIRVKFESAVDIQ